MIPTPFQAALVVSSAASDTDLEPYFVGPGSEAEERRACRGLLVLGDGNLTVELARAPTGGSAIVTYTGLVAPFWLPVGALKIKAGTTSIPLVAHW